MNYKSNSIPNGLYKIVKKCEPFDCWIAYDDLWRKLRPLLKSKIIKKWEKETEEKLVYSRKEWENRQK